MATGFSESITIIVNNVVAPPTSPPTSPFDTPASLASGISNAPARTTPTLQNFASEVLQVPFQIGQDGAIATVSNLSAIAVQEIHSVIATIPGERLMRPGYGSNAHNMIFEPLQDDVDGIAEEIRNSLNGQVVNSTIQLVQCMHDPLDPSQINISVQFVVGPFQTVESTVASVTI